MHIVNKEAIIGSDNGLLPVWCQAIVWNKATSLSHPALGLLDVLSSF